MQGPQVLHGHLQDLRFLQLPRTLQRAGQRGITSPLWLRCAPAGRPPEPPNIGGRSLRTGERRAVAAPPAYLLGQSHGHRLPQLGEAAVDAVPPPLLNHFVGNRRPLQNRRGALVGAKQPDTASPRRPPPAPTPTVWPVPTPLRAAAPTATRPREGCSGGGSSPRRPGGSPSARATPARQACLRGEEWWLFFEERLFEGKGHEGDGTRSSRQLRKAVRAKQTATHPPLLELGGHGGHCIPALSGPFIKPSLLGGDPGGPPQAR